MASVSKPSDLRAFLDSLEVKAKKSLSQNFLIDRNVLGKIVEAADIQPNERVLEIGSGPGALTEFLLSRQAHVIAVEKDDVFANELHRFSGLEVFHGDIRSFPIESIGYGKVVANLPYHLTSPILALLAPRHDLFHSLTLMVQEEVAQRMTAKPGSGQYSSLSLFLRFYTEPKYCFLVSGNCFFPKPKVQSAVVHLKLRRPPSVSSTEGFFKLVKCAFQQRRKMIRSTLKTLYPMNHIEKAFNASKISPEARPETLSLEQFLTLFEELNRKA